MPNVHDVAAYILEKRGKMTTMKLQKLVYYSQAWSLAWDEEPLFEEEIQAWINGPVVPALYEKHKGQYELSEWPLGDTTSLNVNQVETIDIVLDHYGDKKSQFLSDLTHSEDPWIDARKGLPANVRGSQAIKHDSMGWYYQGLNPSA